MRKFVIVIVIFIVVLTILSFNFSLSRITGKSMEPTFASGKTVLLKKYLLNTPDPRRSEVVIYNRGGMDFIGRVIGMPKESVRIENGNIYIDDNVNKYKMDEEYISVPGSTKSDSDKKWMKLGEFDYFIIGDNRSNYFIKFQEDIINRSDIKGALLFSF